MAFAAAVIGDQVGFWFGRKVGPSLFSRPDSRLFKQQNVTKAHAFFERHGAKTIVLARFVPIVRTFAPIVAGVSDMNYRTFVIFNVIGGFLWAVGLTTLGYFMGQIDVVKNNIEIAIVVDHRPVAHPGGHRADQAPARGQAGARGRPGRRSRSDEPGDPSAAVCQPAAPSARCTVSGARAPQVGVVAAGRIGGAVEPGAGGTASGPHVCERAAGPTTSSGPPATSITAWASPAWT